MMNVLFLEIDTRSSWALTSAGPGFIAAFLRQYGHDINLMRIKPEDSPREIIEKIIKKAPDIIGISLTSRIWPRAAKLVFAIKKKVKVPVIAGGLFPTFAPKIVLAAEGFDHVCIGEGEHAMLDLITCLEKGDDPRKKTIDNIWTAHATRPQLRKPAKDLDVLPFVARDFLNETHGVVHMFTQRGCPFLCSYCAAGALANLYGKGYVRRRSVENVIKELAKIKDQGGLNYVIFLDDTFTLNLKWIKNFCRYYKERIGVPFSIQARADTVTPDILFLLAKAGCHHLTFGVESGSLKVRKKVLSRSMTDRQIVNAFAWAKAAGILVTANYMIGLPNETPEDIDMTLELNARLNPDDFGWAVFHPFPGTLLFDLCKNESFLPENWYELPANNTHSILNMPGLTKNDISKYVKKFNQMHEKKQIERYGQYFSDNRTWVEDHSL
ncbi:MAG: B12-binding domain-containing radical SAM protein [Proteobacteria bacterium]|nr:B12-binding domain-containing radical SAM protein [Pseudomonadota bacterium]MBU1583471.1 B12-binding domain-containing radical SAM protein [Pseudomonadota bacterium]MBU2628464.1 B12-binding domain-containing radical SAM protein [Pseudomonadota bacterium]